MKYLKTYEKKIQLNPQVGDYVICNEDEEEYKSSYNTPDILYSDNLCTNFINSNIGKCIFINTNVGGAYYYIQYENIPTEIKDYFKMLHENTRRMMRNEIIYFSSNKEDLEPYINAIKYNI